MSKTKLFVLFYIIINEMIYQISEKEENLFFGKNAQVSVVTLTLRQVFFRIQCVPLTNLAGM